MESSAQEKVPEKKRLRTLLAFLTIFRAFFVNFFPASGLAMIEMPSALRTGFPSAFEATDLTMLLLLSLGKIAGWCFFVSEASSPARVGGSRMAYAGLK